MNPASRRGPSAAPAAVLPAASEERSVAVLAEVSFGVPVEVPVGVPSARPLNVVLPALLSVLLPVLLGSFALACGTSNPSSPNDAGSTPGSDASGQNDGDSGGDGDVPDGGADLDGGTGLDRGPRPTDPPFLTELLALDDLAVLTSSQSGSVKYLARVAGRPPIEPLTEPCYFQNMRQYSWHLLFLHSFPGLEALSFDAYLSLVLRPASRRMYGGSIAALFGVPHPRTGASGVVTFGLYTTPNTLTVEEVSGARQVLSSCAPFATAQLVFVPEGSDQRAMVERERAALAAAGVDVAFPEDLGSGPISVYSPGEAYGTLRRVPPAMPLEDYGPLDIVVTESAPIDISIVAGLVTRTPQNELGHVNLRLREKGIPNASASWIYDDLIVRDLDGKLVHLVASAGRVLLQPARLEDAERFWRDHRPKVRTPEFDLEVAELLGFEVLRATDASAFGAKAANLGELTRVVDPPHRPDGFGIPFRPFDDFIESSGLRTEIEAALIDPRMKTDRLHKRETLALLRDRVEDAPLGESFFEAVRSKILEEFGETGSRTKLRFRSSTNVEDLDELTGAGLYESKSGCLADDLDADGLGPSLCLAESERDFLLAELERRRAELIAHPDRTWIADIIADLEGDLTKEKTVARAIRKVWASLWTERAWDEREYYGIDHRRAFMGIAVHPAAVLERINAVAVSNLRPDQGAPLYTLNSQPGEESVVRPADPTAVAELLTFRREGNEPVGVTILVRSSLLPPDAAVWPADKMVDLAHLLFLAHDHFASTVYPTVEDLALDFEVKLMDDGEVFIKQVRPFVTRDPNP